MVTSCTSGSPSGPRELIVFECHGSRPPSGEPDERGFLGTWSEPPYYYLFYECEAGPGLLRWLERQHGCMLRRSYRINYDQWRQVSSERQKIGPFVIEHHSGSDDSAGRDDELLIRIDPGLVFGSGMHGSSKGCLSAIGRLFERFSIESVVDMGTGTGILAIACAILGASRVLAIDRNPLAARAARRNILLNGVEDRVKVLVAGDLCVLKEPSDLLIMNLEWPSLLQLLPRSEWLNYRWIVLSGSLERQWDKIRIHIPPAFRVLHREIVEDWHTVVLSTLDPECRKAATHYLKDKI